MIPVFLFIYSKRPGTPASDLSDDVSEDEKKRLNIFQHRNNQFAAEISRKMVGDVYRILVTGRSKKDPGEYQVEPKIIELVNFKNINDSILGCFIDVKIVDSYTNSLRRKRINDLVY